MKIITPSRDYPIVIPHGIPTNEFHGWMQTISDAVNNFEGSGGCDNCATKEQGERADIAYEDRFKWDGSPMDNPAAGRASLQLGSAATRPSTDFATYAQGQKADIAYTPDNVPEAGRNLLMAATVEDQQVLLNIPGVVDGFFVPTLAGSTNAGSPVYTKQQGFFCKIGSVTFITIELEWTSTSGMLGWLEVHGIPFECLFSGTILAHYSGWNVGTPKPYAEILDGQSKISLKTISTGGAVANITSSTVNAGGRVVISGQYVTG